MRLTPGSSPLFAGKPHHPVGPDGRMALSDHLRELRARILKIAIVLVSALVVSLFFFDQIFELVLEPYSRGPGAAGRRGRHPGRRSPAPAVR